jgi:PAS domain S-box-containing protein
MIKTLKEKISLVYLCLVISIAIVGAVSVINLYRLSGTIDGLMSNNYKSLSIVSNMMEAIERQDSAILIYMNVDRQKGIDLFTSNSNLFLKWFNDEVNNITEEGEKEYVHKIKEYYSEYIKSFSELKEIRNNQGLNNAVDFYNFKIMPDFNKLKLEMHDLSHLNEKSMFRGKDKATQTAKQSMYATLILSTVTVISGFLLSNYFINRFLSPIYTLKKSIKLVKAGDLDQQINISSKDEIGELAQEFNNMTRRLQQYEKSTMGNLMSEKNKTLGIVKSISDPLIVLDTNYKIVLLNDAFEKFFEIFEDRVVNRYFSEVISNSELFEHISSVLDSKEEYKDKIIQIQSDGDYYYNVVVATVKDNDMNVTGLIVAFQNVTQLKRLERVKTDFVATISHELKTPLTSIVMGTSMILDESMGSLNEDQKSVMNTIREDEIRLSNLVNELLELSKIESEKAIFNIVPCSIDIIIDNSLKQFYEQAEQKGVSLNYVHDENLPRVCADFQKVTWVINNLITNALKYTNAGDEICVSANVKEGKMFVSVKDTGAGIPKEFQDKIFEKFVQVKGQDMEVRGTGLGLAIVKEIIETHEGDIWCESKLDEGSNFVFTLLLSEKEKLR